MSKSNSRYPANLISAEEEFYGRLENEERSKQSVASAGALPPGWHKLVINDAAGTPSAYMHTNGKLQLNRPVAVARKSRKNRRNNRK